MIQRMKFNAAVYARKPYVILCDIYPEDRLNYILKDCDADLVLDVSKKSCSFNKTIIKSEDIDNFVKEYEGCEALDCDDFEKDKLAVLIYTSGSTGYPKGVEITYGGLENRVYSETFVSTIEWE